MKTFWYKDSPVNEVAIVSVPILAKVRFNGNRVVTGIEFSQAGDFEETSV